MSQTNKFDHVRPIRWTGQSLQLLDQRILPLQVAYLDLHTAEQVAQAIRDLVVRGAPAIGISAAFGVVLAAKTLHAASSAINAITLAPALDVLAKSRPTAVNLFWALARLRDLLGNRNEVSVAEIENEAIAIEREDLAANHHMGDTGAALIAQNSGVLTHCNTGSLATAGFGTALGVIRAAFAQGKLTDVFAGETRPWLQGSRLTVWELAQDQIPATLIADSAASHLLSTGKIHWVIVGADRIAANGDVANKIGTYQLAISAKHHGVKMMVVAPSSTVDMAIANGGEIEIETRDPKELLSYGGQPIAAEGVQAWNPVFDVTPASLIDCIVTEKGVVQAPNTEKMRALFS